MSAATDHVIADHPVLTRRIYQAIERAEVDTQIHQVLFHDIPHCVGITDEEREALIIAATEKFKKIYPPTDFGRRNHFKLAPPAHD